MTRLYKTTLVVYTDEDPAGWDLETLGHEADRGSAICASTEHTPVDPPYPDVEEGVLSFFDLLDDGEGDEEADEEDPDDGAPSPQAIAYAQAFSAQLRGLGLLVDLPPDALPAEDLGA